jgi:hypothetical protein
MNQSEIIIYSILGAAGVAGVAYAVNKKHKRHTKNQVDDFKTATAGENSQKIKLDSDDAELRDAEYHLKKAEKELLKTKTFKERFKASEKVDRLQKEFNKVSSLKHRSKKGGFLNKKTRKKSRK